jgi:hypothetical protein
LKGTIVSSLFADSFEAGLAAAKQADAARAEVKAVLAELDQQIRSASGGALSIQLEEVPNPLQNKYLAAVGHPQSHWALMAKNLVRPEVAGKELAMWEGGQAGYPVRLSYPGVIVACEDRKGLEDALAALLQNTSTGMALSRLLGG